jgi:hypothetical protein
MLNDIQSKINNMKHAAQNRFNQNRNNLRGQMQSMGNRSVVQQVVNKVMNKIK